MGKLILIRHGQTEMNKEGMYYGRLDVHINENGKKQAEKACEILKNLNIDYDKIYASTMIRAKETAEIVNYKKLPIEESPLIMEMDFGIFEGLTYEELKVKYPEQLKKSAEDWKNYSYETGENPYMLQERAVKFLNTLDKNINNLVVTHWGIICSLMSWLFSHKLDGYWKFQAKNGGIVIIDFDDGFPILDGFNIGG